MEENKKATAETAEVKSDTVEMTESQLKSLIAEAIRGATDPLREQMQELRAQQPARIQLDAENKATVPAEAIDPIAKAFGEKAKKAEATAYRVPENEFSFARFFDAQMNHDWSNAKFEKKVLDYGRGHLGAISKTAPLAYGTGANGGFWVPQEFLPEQFFMFYRANLVAAKLGATVIQANAAPVRIPKMTAGATTYWISENAAITASTTETAAELQLTPKFLVARTQISQFLNQVSQPTAEQIVRQDLALSIANEVDDTFLEGTPSTAVPGKPNGVSEDLASGNIVAIGANGGALTMALLRDMEYKLQVANIPDGGWAWVIHPRTWHGICELLIATEANHFLFGNQGSVATQPEQSVGRQILGYPVYLTTNLTITLAKGSATAGGINLARLMLGKWSDAIICEWGGLQLEATNVGGNAWANNQIEVKATKVMDVGVRNDTSFAMIEDSTT